jgi:hypothetical protein
MMHSLLLFAKRERKKNMTRTQQAWTAFVLSSALIVGTLFPIINYGFIFLHFPIFLLFGCDSAQSGNDCLRIQLIPWLPPMLTIATLIACPIAINRNRYAASVLIAASACAVSWLTILSEFH